MMATGDPLFFIYDENVMQQNEHDDIAEAVLYYQPKTSEFVGDKEDEMMLFFGHIVGTVKCTETIAHSLPSFISLERCKFSVVRLTHFLLFLGYGNIEKTIPAAFIKKKLQKFVDLFSFYRGSFDRMLSFIDIDKHDFERTMSHFLSIAFHCEAPMQNFFDPIPTVAFDKTTSSIAAKATHILEACQRRESVCCGTLLAEGKVLSSQVPPSMLHNLLFVKDHHMDKHACSFDPGFDCPLGVRIMQVYLTREQYLEIVDISSKCPYSKVICGIKEQADVDNAGLSKTISSTSIMSMKDNFQESESHKRKSSTSSDTLNASYNYTDGDIQQIKEGVNVKIFTCDLPKGSPISPDLLNTLKVNSLDLNVGESSTGTMGVNGGGEGSDEDLQNNSEDKVSQRLDLTTLHMKKPCVDKEVSGSNRDQNQTEEQINDDTHKMHLYVQSHSDVLLILFMEVEETYEYSNLKTLWEMLLPHLGDIEAQVKTMAPLHEKENKGKGSVNMKFVRYDSMTGLGESNVTNMSTEGDRCFGDAVNLFHHQFQSSSISDITFMAANVTHGYAKKSLFEEVYLQQRGSYKPTNGPPVSSDGLWQMDQQAGQKIKKISKSVMI